MTPLPKKKHSSGRTGRREAKKRLTKKSTLSIWSKQLGIKKRLESLGLSKLLK